MKLLFLTHRIPYPPNKGDKISSFHMMRYFSKSHDVYLGTFIDDKNDLKYIDALSEYCRDVKAVPISPRYRFLSSGLRLFSGRPLSISYYRNRGLGNWVRKTVEAEHPDAILLFSGCTAQFLEGIDLSGSRVVFDAEDVDSEKWKSYAADKAWPLSWLYAREGRLLLDYERRMAARFEATVFVSEEEADLFRSLAPESAQKVTHRTQGVDIAFFDPELDFSTPYRDGEKPLLFVGAMNYWPNVKAVTWFAETCFPRILKTDPQARFYIVGLSPDDSVRRLGEQPGIVVTGGVEDVRPYFKHARAVCLPMTIARGIQNKMLEAMAMRKRILASPAAAAGIRMSSDFTPMIAETEEDFIDAAIKVLSETESEDYAAREVIVETYSWDANLARFETLVFGDEG